MKGSLSAEALCDGFLPREFTTHASTTPGAWLSMTSRTARAFAGFSVVGFERRASNTTTYPTGPRNCSTRCRPRLVPRCQSGLRDNRGAPRRFSNRPAAGTGHCRSCCVANRGLHCQTEKMPSLAPRRRRVRRAELAPQGIESRTLHDGAKI